MADGSVRPSRGKPAAAPRKANATRPALTRGTGAVYVYDSLKAQILDLALKPGTLLDETVVSSQFGVSRSPVREALIRLSAEGLVQNLRNRTSIVAPFDVATLPAYLDARQLLYRLSARLAAGNSDPASIAALHRNIEAHESALIGNDMHGMIRLNREFHACVAEMSGNPFVAGWMNGLLDQGQRLLRLYARSLGDRLPGTVLQAHRAMLAAIEAQDADGAERAGREDAQVLADQFRRALSQPASGAIMLGAETMRRA